MPVTSRKRKSRTLTQPPFRTLQKVGGQSTGCQLLLHFRQDGRRVVGIVGRGRKGIPGSHGVEDSGVTSLIKASYELLGLASFLTAGEKEARAWTFRKGMTAPQRAGVIHTDFEKAFIKAEVVSYEDLIAAGSMQKARDAGKLRFEGKEYVFVDGDVVLFKCNA